MSKPKVYYRKCDYEPCGKGMNKGFVVEDWRTYCSMKHMLLAEKMTKAEYIELYDDGDGSTYWTEWEDDDGGAIYNRQGVLIGGEE